MITIEPEIVRLNRKSLTIQISPYGKVIVKAPHLLPKFIINQFIKQKEMWIKKQIQIAQLRPKKVSNSFDEGELFWYLGKPYKLKYGNYVAISITTAMQIPLAYKFRIQKELKSWYMQKAKEIINQRINNYANEMQLHYCSVRFSDTSSKWGSCSPENDLQFSWRLVMAPLTVIDYVVVHELAHTQEKNHQHNFWKLVEKHKPAYKQYIKWLKSHSLLLHSML